MNGELKQLLTENFLNWQIEKGSSKSQREFAEEVLGIHKVTYSRIYNGNQKITKKMLVLFAEKTGDPRFYDLAEVPRPDPDFDALKALWKYIPEEQRHALREQGEAYASQNREDNN